ncbi:MAG: DinB family protein [Planctomycetaceae bacterium]
MKSNSAIQLNIDMAQMCCNMYLDDLTDADLMLRPHSGCNHINWQIGHLITSDHELVSAVCPGTMPPLPEGFAAKYSKETANSDDASKFCSKSELLATAAQQHEAMLNALNALSDEDLDRASPEPVNAYAPTVGAVFSMLGSHWMMHSGQWVVVRRQLGKPPLF